MTETYRLLYYDTRGIGEPIRYIFAYIGVPYEDIRIKTDELIDNPSKLLRRPLPIPPEWEKREYKITNVVNFHPKSMQGSANNLWVIFVIGVPYGKVPVLEIERDGGQVRTLVSAKPICRYLASKYGLTAEDPFEDSQCDEYMDSLTDYTGSKPSLHKYNTYLLNVMHPNETLLVLRPIYACEDREARAQLLARVHEAQTPRYLGTFDTIIRENNGYNLVGNKLTWADIYLAHVMDNFTKLLDADLLKNYPSLANLVHTVLNIPAIKDWIQVRPNSYW